MLTAIIHQSLGPARMTDSAEIPSAQILLVDDEVDHADVMAEALRRLGHVCTIVHDLNTASDELRHGAFDLIVTDLVMNSEDDGLKVLEIAKQTQPTTHTILVTAHGDVSTAKAAIKGGAYDFIEKPLDLEVFRTLCSHAIREVMLRHQNVTLRKQVDEKFGLEGIVGSTPAIHRVLTMIRQVAPSDIPVLITGESGTGKELVARAIHSNSQRGRQNFKPLNCAGLSESILESELFGHVRGAFTGAERDRKGVFEYADRGTLLLDEIGDMSMAMQAKLLRVLESGELVRVGSNEPINVDVRLLSATNHDLQELISEGRFREDLFYRIRGAEVHMPPLRERRDDIPLLVRHFIDHFARRTKKDVHGIDDDAVLLLLRNDWPGNVRQLMSVIQNMVLTCEGNILETRHVPLELRQTATDAADTRSLDALAGLSLEQIEKQAIRSALSAHGGNREQAAKILGIGERTLYRKLKEYGLK